MAMYAAGGSELSRACLVPGRRGSRHGRQRGGPLRRHAAWAGLQGRARSNIADLRGSGRNGANGAIAFRQCHE